MRSSCRLSALLVSLCCSITQAYCGTIDQEAKDWEADYGMSRFAASIQNQEDATTRMLDKAAKFDSREPARIKLMKAYVELLNRTGRKTEAEKVATEIKMLWEPALERWKSKNRN